MTLLRSWPKNDQGVEKLECRGCDNEHVDRDHVAHVVAQEGAPGRGGRFGSPWHVPTDGGLADFNAKFEQFAVDSGCAQAGWPCSSGGSDHGSRCSSWAA